MDDQRGTGDGDNAATRTPPPMRGGLWEQYFIENLRRLREASKLSQTDLAKEIKNRGLAFHQQTIQRIERGERPIRLNEAHVISEILGVDLGLMTTSIIVGSTEAYLGLESIARSMRVYADDEVESYQQCIKSLEEFASVIYGALLNTDGVEFGEGSAMATLVSYPPFAELPLGLQIGIACCAKLKKSIRVMEAAIMNLCRTTGDDQGNTDPEDWQYGFPWDDQILIDIGNWASAWDSDELRMLENSSIEVLLRSLRIEIEASGERHRILNMRGDRGLH